MRSTRKVNTATAKFVVGENCECKLKFHSSALVVAGSFWHGWRAASDLNLIRGIYFSYM